MTLFLYDLEENIKQIEKLPLKTPHLPKYKTICNPHYYLGNRHFYIIMTRLRICSKLRHHLFDMNIIDNNNCECDLLETTSHCFLECPLYIVPRHILCDFCLRNNYEFTVYVFLYGISNGINNFIINQATQEYIIAINRFNLLNNLPRVF